MANIAQNITDDPASTGGHIVQEIPPVAPNAVTGAVTGAAVGGVNGANPNSDPPKPPVDNGEDNGYQSGSGGGGYSGGGYPNGGGAPSIQQELVTANAEAGNPVIDNTNYLLEEYNKMNEYQQQQEQLVKDSTQELINLANQQIDETVGMQIREYTAQLDQAKQQYSQLRAKLEQMKATEADNLALQRAANGDRGGIGQAQYSAQMQQRDQALYEIDLAQVNLEREIERAIADAKATGNYQKLGQQIELLTAQYEQLYNLASQVMQVKTSDAAQLDQYYLQVEQLEQNTILSKISAGITVTAEDMAQFGLTGADAQSAADAINHSFGIERQMLVEQLKQLQNANNAYSYGGGGYGGGSGGTGYTGYTGGADGSEASSGGNLPNSAMLTELQQKSNNGTLYIFDSNGNGTGRKLTLTIDANGNVSYDTSGFRRGEYVVLSDGTRLYADGNGGLVDQEARDYNYNDSTSNWMSAASAYASGANAQIVYNNLKAALPKQQNIVDELIAKAQIAFSNQNGGAWISRNQIQQQLKQYLNNADYQAYVNALNAVTAINGLISDYDSNGGWR